MITINGNICTDGVIYVYRFDGKIEEYVPVKYTRVKFCIRCDQPLAWRYSYIIFRLLEAGLLPKNYIGKDFLCCGCSVKKKRLDQNANNNHTEPN